MKYIVTTGGQGTKLWPLSRKDKPKQFQQLIKDKSLFSYTIDTLLKSCKTDDIYISTKRRYLKYILDQAPSISYKNYIIEPDFTKNRGPAEGFAFLTLSMQHPGEPFLIVQVDCLRSPENKFLKMISEMEKLVKRDKKFISGGIKATSPVLGVDYLKLGDRIPTKNGLEIYSVDEYIERNNDYLQTKMLVENYNITTHSNHNCWYPDLMLDAYKKYKPSWYKSLMNIKECLGKSASEDKISEIYSKMEAGPTEEVTQHLFKEGYIVLVPYRWVDVGTWNSIYDYFSADNDNYTDGKVLAMDSGGSIIKSTNPNKLIVAMGIDDMIIVDTKDALLLIPRNKSGKISDILKTLEKKGKEKYL